eukprot:1179638-Prorocentrum_minimum.AAC.2
MTQSITIGNAGHTPGGWAGPPSQATRPAAPWPGPGPRAPPGRGTKCAAPAPARAAVYPLPPPAPVSERKSNRAFTRQTLGLVPVPPTSGWYDQPFGPCETRVRISESVAVSSRGVMAGDGRVTLPWRPRQPKPRGSGG